MADSDKPAESGVEEAIRAYKEILSHIIDQRPSGMRQRLADPTRPDLGAARPDLA